MCRAGFYIDLVVGDTSPIFRKLQLPAALPSIFVAIRLGASLGLVGAIVGEWFGAPNGLGVVLQTSFLISRG